MPGKDGNFLLFLSFPDLSLGQVSLNKYAEQKYSHEEKPYLYSQEGALKGCLMSKYKTINKDINFAKNVGKRRCIPSRIYLHPLV